MPNAAFDFVIFEYWDVPEQNMAQFMHWYENIFFGALTHCPTYAGLAINTRSKEALAKVLGHGDGPRKAIAYHPFLSQLGTRTDAMVDFDALLKDEWNVVGMQFFTKDVNLETMFDDWAAGFEKVQPGWREENPGLTLEEVVIKDFFSLVNNHWDVFMDCRFQAWADGPRPATASWLKRGVAQ